MKVAGPIEMTRDQLSAVLEYSEESGELRWKPRPDYEFSSLGAAKSWNSRYAGKLAGSKLHKPGGISYMQVSLGRKTLKAHRLIWILVHGSIDESLMIDHVNGNGLDNRLVNLRLVTPRDNSKNRSVRSRNRSGVVGVYWNSHEQKWHARIQINGVRKSIGQYDSLEDAKQARRAHQAAQDYHPLHGLSREARALSN
ncbi:HNH endonuclease [Pseudomonas capeferrum]|uniref:HNH endonuclease n=1 Tax=Pseudomonas capeferrum TaxID=1495066 RepID=UPI0015E4410F|nr:HNH endonuclease [Pseudomonas capeferrum]MBA1200473.1 HNH endonuclease [Pseudomonas capeferrum]